MLLEQIAERFAASSYSSTYGLWRASPRLGLHYDAKTMQPQEAARAIAPDLSVHVVLPSIGLDLRLKGHEREHDGNAHDVDSAEGDEIWCHGERLITRTHASYERIRSITPQNAAALFYFRNLSKIMRVHAID